MMVLALMAGQAAAQPTGSISTDAHHLARVIGAATMARMQCGESDAAGLNAVLDALWAEVAPQSSEHRAFITGWSLAVMEEGMRQTLGRDPVPEECERAMAALARAQARRQVGR